MQVQQTGDVTRDWYTRFAVNEARGQSAIYEAWATGVAGDDEVLDLIRELPRPKQQPNLVFACSRLLGAPEGEYAPWREWLLANWPAVADAALQRATQTNEPRRCALLLPLLAAIEGPIALLEVGASAGLCLYPDRYAYRYDDDPVLGESDVLLECATTGPVPLPDRLPEIVWRAGLDLNPLRVDDADDMRWLETLVWPEQVERRERIRRAIELARREPVRLVAGDGRERLREVAADAPDDATLVVFHAGTIVYLGRDERAAFADDVCSLAAERGRTHWISIEGQGVTPGVQPDGTGGSSTFALALDGDLVALAGPHGQSLDWLA
ncbi:hypothetical protein ARHIZOSPH14_19200 [Agromyces rhizosphaerae]|uniref:DUF2332 family protein n=1 Tax=Agromyces rhizosphaerae TaxID=88374 RepID=A0A9W6FS15_9MICO|nr:DUF2332 domain-containing protein [Agromyces rhizosphaerae]GLI27678.1 hypothetical protein ARHIZOSPH14_19200 [Agromyces rhizosphaerae]